MEAETDTVPGDTVAARLRRIVRDVVHDHGPLGIDDELAAAGIDSMATIEIVGRVESEFGITFSEADISHDNFSSLRAMTSLVERRRP